MSARIGPAAEHPAVGKLQAEASTCARAPPATHGRSAPPPRCRPFRLRGCCPNPSPRAEPRAAARARWALFPDGAHRLVLLPPAAPPRRCSRSRGRGAPCRGPSGRAGETPSEPPRARQPPRRPKAASPAGWTRGSPSQKASTRHAPSQAAVQWVSLPGQVRRARLTAAAQALPVPAAGEGRPASVPAPCRAAAAPAPPRAAEARLGPQASPASLSRPGASSAAARPGAQGQGQAGRLSPRTASQADPRPVEPAGPSGRRPRGGARPKQEGCGAPGDGIARPPWTRLRPTRDPRWTRALATPRGPRMCHPRPSCPAPGPTTQCPQSHLGRR
mmetsp:Transcript_35186/g.83480  ORF Transcript_35186/g.83480 Transcript_35186/m.83480 type:complete len:331 (+) Transcript_35186:596-1588(+)